MPRPSTGSVVTLRRKRGTIFALRFRAYGERRYVTLGSAEDGWDSERAEATLRHTLADVERGIWRPPVAPEHTEPQTEPTLHEFATDWLAEKEPELAPKTVLNYRWALSNHLLPALADLRLSELTAAQIDRFKADKLREGKLGANQINTVLGRLAQVLEDAVEYGHLERNPARGRRRRLRGTRPRRSWVEPEQLPSLIEAADSRLRPLVATMAGAGLRAGEAVALNWGDLNLATGTLTVRQAKTDAGTGRQVDLALGVREELLTLRAKSAATAPSDPVFVSREREGTVSRQTVSNVGRRLKTTIRRANERLEKLDIEPISDRVSPHSLRRTYASLRAALRDDPVYIAEQLGHTDFAFTFRVYQKATKRRERLSGAYLEQYDTALDWALMGTSEVKETRRATDSQASHAPETASQSRKLQSSPDSSVG